MNQSDSPTRLPPYERVAACLLVITLLCFIVLHFYLDESKKLQPSDETHFIVNPYVEITIKGAVAKPGVYQVKKGTPIDDVLQKAEPLDSDNLKRIKRDSKVTRRRTINVPFL